VGRAALLVQGIFINTLFGAMHESVHYGSFKTRWMADVLAFFSGAAILNNAGFYGTITWRIPLYADPERDPELVTSGTPRTWGQYLFRVSSIPFLMLRLRDIFLFPFGYRGDVDYIHPSAWPRCGAGALAARALCRADCGLDRPADDVVLWLWLFHCWSVCRSCDSIFSASTRSAPTRRRLRQHPHHAQ